MNAAIKLAYELSGKRIAFIVLGNNRELIVGLRDPKQPITGYPLCTH